MVYYPALVGEMAKREVQKKEVAESIGICYRAFSNKLNGKTPFTWPEVCTISRRFFPDMDKDNTFCQGRAGQRVKGLARGAGRG